MSSSKIEELKKLRNSINLVVNGKPEIIKESPTIVICNHNCLKDIFYLPMSLSEEDKIISLISSRLIYKRDIKRQEIVNRYLYSMPIEAHGGKEYANLCLDSAANLLSNGYNLNIFPEGAYIDDKEHVYKGRTGAARILFSAKENGINPNIIPISIDVSQTEADLDSYNLNGNDKVVVNVLDPIDYTDTYYDYKNSSSFEEKNANLHKIVDIGMRSIAESLNREYVDSYIELCPKKNVIFENGEKIDTDIARKKQYYIVYKRGLENRCKSLKKVLK